jgi:hypothetical protein
MLTVIESLSGELRDELKVKVQGPRVEKEYREKKENGKKLSMNLWRWAATKNITPLNISLSQLTIAV